MVLVLLWRCFGGKAGDVNTFGAMLVTPDVSIVMMVVPTFLGSNFQMSKHHIEPILPMKMTAKKRKAKSTPASRTITPQNQSQSLHHSNPFRQTSHQFDCYTC